MVARGVLASVAVASVLVGGIAVSGAVGESSAPCAGTPELLLVDSDPVTLAGSRFCAGEKLRIRARTGAMKRARRRQADDGGSFSVQFPRLDYDPCTSALWASARSGGEQRARLKRPRKMCPVPLAPG
jgi:hypothetical protein